MTIATVDEGAESSSVPARDLVFKLARVLWRRSERLVERSGMEEYRRVLDRAIFAVATDLRDIGEWPAVEELLAWWRVAERPFGELLRGPEAAA